MLSDAAATISKVPSSSFMPFSSIADSIVGKCFLASVSNIDRVLAIKSAAVALFMLAWLKLFFKLEYSNVDV